MTTVARYQRPSHRRSQRVQPQEPAPKSAVPASVQILTYPQHMHPVIITTIKPDASPNGKRFWESTLSLRRHCTDTKATRTGHDKIGIPSQTVVLETAKISGAIQLQFLENGKMDPLCWVGKWWTTQPCTKLHG